MSREKELEKRLKQLTQHIIRTRKKLRDNNMWLIGGFNALADSTDEAQQGPMINKLYEIVNECKRVLKEK